MDDKTALTVLTNMHATAVSDTAALDERLKSLNEDYAKDPWADTAAQISRISGRVTRRRLEAEALAAALQKF